VQRLACALTDDLFLAFWFFFAKKKEHQNNFIISLCLEIIHIYRLSKKIDIPFAYVCE